MGRKSWDVSSFRRIISWVGWPCHRAQYESHIPQLLLHVTMVQFSQALTAVLLATGVVAHPGGNTNKEILRRQAHLDHPNRRTVQECKRDLVESGWVREQHLRREARLHELRVAAGFAKEHEIVRRDPAEVEENYGAEAACTLDPEATEGPYCMCTNNNDEF